MLVKKDRRIFYVTPKYSDFPKKEYDDRLRKVRKRMEEKKIDVLVLWDDHNVRYFSGFSSTHWSAKSLQPAVFVLSTKHEPILVIPEFFRGQAEATSFAWDIRGQEKPHHIRSLRDLPVEVASLIKEMGYSKTRIGLEDGNEANMYIPRPISDIDRFRNELPNATFVPAAEIIWQCRMIKSPLELESLKCACSLTVEAFKEFHQVCKLGMSESEAATLLYSAVVKRGLQMDGMYFVGNPDRYPMIDSHPTFEGVQLNAGDHLVIECAGLYKGYHGSVGHCFEIGAISDQKWEFINAVNLGQDAALSALKDGAKAKDIIAAVGESLAERGFKATGFVGHGVGLTAQEPPDLTDEQTMTLRKGMVLAIEVWIYDIKNFTRGGRINLGQNTKSTNYGQFGMEQLVLVKDGGYEMLPTFPRQINTIA
jgi:Xaa-Pro dipeptidase